MAILNLKTIYQKLHKYSILRKIFSKFFKIYVNNFIKLEKKENLMLLKYIIDRPI